MPTISISAWLRDFRGAAGKPGTQMQNIGDLAADRIERIERRHGLLKDHRDAAAADRVERHLRRMKKLGAFEGNRALRLGAVRQKPEHGERREAFPRARFADERQRLSAHDIEGQAFHGLLRGESRCEDRGMREARRSLRAPLGRLRKSIAQNIQRAEREREDGGRKDEKIRRALHRPGAIGDEKPEARQRLLHAEA